MSVPIAKGRNGFVAGPRAVGSFVPRLTQKAFERFGFPQAAIITDWPAIAGTELARFTRPERLKWPRAGGRDEPTDPPPRGSRPQAGATLLLRVDGPRAIELQHKAPQLIERINAYFGFRAVTELRLLQAPIARTPELPRAGLNKAKAPKLSARPNGESASLSDALARLATALSARGASSERSPAS